MDRAIRMRLKWVKLYEKTKDAGFVCRRCGISRLLRNFHFPYSEFKPIEAVSFLVSKYGRSWHRPHGALNGKTSIDRFCELSSKTPIWAEVEVNYDLSKERIQEPSYWLD